MTLASKPQVLENCPVLGSRTAVFFEPLKLCIIIIINGQRCKRICYRLVKSIYTLRGPHLAPLQLQLPRCCSFVWLLVELRKSFSFLEVRGQFVNVTFCYHIVNSGFGDSKMFNTNILVTLAIANMMIWCFIL